MKEKFIKFVIIALTAFFSVSTVYADIERDYTKVTWIDKDGVVIGYKLDEFSPTKDTLKVNPTKDNVKKENPMISGRDVLQSLVRSILFYFLFIIVIWIGLFFGVIILLTIISLYHKFQNKR